MMGGEIEDRHIYRGVEYILKRQDASSKEWQVYRLPGETQVAMILDDDQDYRSFTVWSSPDSRAFNRKKECDTLTEAFHYAAEHF
ncbi:hypothetical protein SAMN05660916_02068 [Arthrobacter sp. 31Cvi3.1E]|nr:hypothetical protein [Paenarthrobacter nicotinovorans]SKB67429.1 hypothetical protein SAMN05660916_02068 [Arthrobacter sp. 31Cvi3.1E]